MKNRNNIISTMTALMTVLLLATGSLCLAAQARDAKQAQPVNLGSGVKVPAKPSAAEAAAKAERVRKQQEQRVTHDQRKASAASLQAERKKVYDAKQAVKNSQQQGNNQNKHIKQ